MARLRPASDLIYTVGHSTRSLAEFLARPGSFQIGLVADALKAGGWDVRHIVAPGKAVEHPGTKPAIWIDGGVVYAHDPPASQMMNAPFEIGERVTWNSEAGWVTGTIIGIHTADFDYKGHTHHATGADPQYEIKSDKSDHIAAHKGGALHRIP